MPYALLVKSWYFSLLFWKRLIWLFIISDLEFKNLDIINAANDCFDVSGGRYSIKEGILKNCQDKAISVGEKSNLTVNKIIINGANIGVAAKDLSKVSVIQMEAINTNICADVRRKKQEFGGAELTINEYKCSAKVDVGAESVFLNGELWVSVKKKNINSYVF